MGGYLKCRTGNANFKGKLNNHTCNLPKKFPKFRLCENQRDFIPVYGIYIYHVVPKSTCTD